MSATSPRRAGARWSESAPPFILDCFDNKGATVDRYTVMFCAPYADTAGEVLYLSLSGAPAHPQGVSQWGGISPREAAAYRYSAKRQRVRWLDLPEHIRAHVVARWNAS